MLPLLSTEILTLVQNYKLSDLHIKPDVSIAIRLDGEIVHTSSKVLTAKDIESFINHYLSESQLKSLDETLDCDLAIEMGEYRFRVNILNSSLGVSLVLRKIDSEIPSADQLNLPFVAQDMANKHNGLILVTGPTGSGKSTSLAAIIDLINRSHKGHILTIEDPIEFVHESKKCLVNQREVHRDTHGFSEALRSALREDPDIILVGELRDLETIRLALTAAETGHLVFGTLHTTSAAKTIDRVVDVFPANEKSMVRSMLSESLQAVISQTLLKKNGGGRVAGHEIMRGTSAIRNLIREDKVAQMYSAIQTGGALGMQTIDQCLADLVAKRVISREVAREKAKMPDNF